MEAGGGGLESKGLDDSRSSYATRNIRDSGDDSPYDPCWPGTMPEAASRF